MNNLPKKIINGPFWSAWGIDRFLEYGRAYSAALLTLVMMVLIQPVVAGINSWTSIGPGGGSISSVIVDPTTPSIVYAGTGGGLYKSIDGGVNWAAINSGLIDTSITALAIDPVTPTTLYAGTQAGGVFKSVDGGVSWAAINTGFVKITGTATIAIDPVTPTTLYVSTWDGAYVSTNGGANWGRIGLPVGSGYAKVVIDPTVSGIVYTTTNGGKNVYKSMNYGLNWLPLTVTLTAGEYIHELAIDPNNPTTLYFTVSDPNSGFLGEQLRKSVNGGINWTTFRLPNASSVYSLVVDPASSNILYAATMSFGGGGVLKSTDAGATWRKMNNGLPVLVDGVMNSLAFDPTAPGTIYVGTGTGLYKTTNGGNNWVLTSSSIKNADVNTITFDPVTPSTLYAGNYNGIYTSKDSGITWSKIASAYVVSSIVVDPSVPTTLYAGMEYGSGFTSALSSPSGGAPRGPSLVKSIDGGTSWSSIETFGSSYRALAIDPLTPGTLYAGSYSGIKKSTDGGATWITLNGGLPPDYFAYTLLVDPNNSSVLYTAGNGGGSMNLYKSVDGGTNWTALNPGFLAVAGWPYTDFLKFDPVTTSTLYAGVTTWNYPAGFSGSIYKSIDSGSTWVRVGLNSAPFTSFAIDPGAPTTFYAASFGGGGVFRSIDAGVSWAPMNTGLLAKNIGALVIDPANTNHLYAGTQGGGVYSYTVQAVSAETERESKEEVDVRERRKSQREEDAHHESHNKQHDR